MKKASRSNQKSTTPKPDASASVSLDQLCSAIIKDELKDVRTILKSAPILAREIWDSDDVLVESIAHYIYIGDTALHVAAAAYRLEIAKLLLAAGADVNAAQNRRRSSPLHYASDGSLENSNWSESRQVAMLQLLLDSGAKLDVQDANGATPLHRAVRTRCASAVECLLEQGANPKAKNKPGSTPFHLAVQNTGRGGSGAVIAKEGQVRIIRLFLKHGVSTKMRDGSGKTVLECAKDSSIQAALAGAT